MPTFRDAVEPGLGRLWQRGILDMIHLSEVQLKLGIGKHLVLLANIIANDEQRSSFMRGALLLCDCPRP